MNPEDRLRMMEALANADAAGDTEAAAKLAQMVRDYDEQASYQKEPGPEAPLNDPMANWASGVGDVARTAVDVVGFGGADTGFGFNSPEETARQRALTAQSRENLGLGAIPTEFAAGALQPTGVPARLGRGLQIAGHGISGGAQAALDAYGHGEDWGDIGKAALVGSGISGAASAVTDPIASWMTRRKQRAATPSNEDVKAASDAKYKAVRDAGGVYTNADLRSLAAEITNMKLVPGIDDRAIALRKRLLTDWKNKDISPDDFDKIRQWVRKKMKTADPSQRATGEEFVKGMDKFADRANVVVPPKGGAQGPGQLVPGVNADLKEARKQYSQYRKASDVAKAAEPPEKSKGGMFNVHREADEGPMRDRFGKIVKKIDERGGAGYSADEATGVKRMAQGTTARNIGDIGRSISPFGGSLAAKIVAGIGGGLSLGTLPIAQTAIGEGMGMLGRAAREADLGDLQHLIKTGKKVTTDVDEVARKKDLLARLARGATGAGLRQFGGPR